MKEKKNRKFSIILACAAILLVCVMVFLLTGYMRDIISAVSRNSSTRFPVRTTILKII